MKGRAGDPEDYFCILVWSTLQKPLSYTILFTEIPFDKSGVMERSGVSRNQTSVHSLGVPLDSVLTLSSDTAASMSSAFYHLQVAIRLHPILVNNDLVQLYLPLSPPVCAISLDMKQLAFRKCQLLQNATVHLFSNTGFPQIIEPNSGLGPYLESAPRPRSSIAKRSSKPLE